ncbi:MAG: hypothetical protein HOV80_27010 [Polyangiaceae bacterium]|nr:hypothetical protein [Polyangiaceae bacterium]
MKDLPAWVGELQNDAALSSDLALTWLDAEAQDATRDLWRSTWNQVPFDEAFHERGAKRIERCVPLAEGPVRRRRLQKTESKMVLVFDPEEPDVAWLSLSHAMPPAAWAVAGSTAAELRSAIGYYTPASDSAALELPRTERLVKPIEIESFDPIKNSIEALELWIDDASWGSAFFDDPWTNVERDAGMMLLSIYLRKTGAQSPGCRPSFGYRTLWSRSLMTIEQHPFGHWVFDLKYRPAKDRRAIEMLSGSEEGARLPPDLPVDLAASLMRGSSLTRESLRINQSRDWGPGEVAALCAVDPGEATTIANIRSAIGAWAGDPKLFDLVQVLRAYEHTALLFEVAATTKDEVIRAMVGDLLAPGVAS